MNIVIVCADQKKPYAGYLRQQDGQKVKFVADPDSAPPAASCVYARPDDISDIGVSWTETLRQYNETPENNPLGLLPAWELYSNPNIRGFGTTSAPEPSSMATFPYEGELHIIVALPGFLEESP